MENFEIAVVGSGGEEPSRAPTSSRGGRLMTSSELKVVSEIIEIKGVRLEVGFIPIGQVRYHEGIFTAKVARLASSIESEGVVNDPILVVRMPSGDFIVGDGHHRSSAISGKHERVIAHIVDYRDLYPQCRCQ